MGTVLLSFLRDAAARLDQTSPPRSKAQDRDSSGFGSRLLLPEEEWARHVDALHYYQLAGCVAQYTSVNIILWTIFSIFAAAHALLINAVVVLNEKGVVSRIC